tara:strand:+ start:3579 stop:5789 length:2211 start_codon:yes stop_codon:yes gene_type:complete
MSAVARNMTIDYGSTTVGGTVGGAFVSIHDIHTLSRDESSFDLSATLLVTSGTAALLAAGCAALETAFTVRRKDLVVTIGGSTFIEFRQGTTALNIRSSISKSGSQADSSLSRLYEISISGDTSPTTPPQTSSFSATYGSQDLPGSVSGGAALTLHEIHSIFRDEARFDVSLSVLVKATSASQLASSCSALETTFTTRRLDFVAKMGATDIASFKHSNNTGLDIRSSISKSGSQLDSELTRLYRITITGVTTQATPPQTTNLSFTYGTVTVGGTLSGATLSLYNVHSITRDQDTFSLSASVLVRAANASTLASACVDLEDEFTTRRLDLAVTMGGNTILELKQSDNSAINTTSSIEKQGSPIDSELARLYLVSVSGEIPTKAALSALRSFNYDVTYSPSRRITLVATGTYTAVVGTAAAAQYLASINARVSTITTALTGTWELVNETYTPDDTDQVVNFSRTYQNLIYENASSLYISGIRNQTLTVKADRFGADGLKDERKLISAVATYSASISTAVTTGLTNTWAWFIRPYILTEIEKVLDNQTYAVIKQSVDYDSVENRLDAVIEVRGKSSSNTLSHTVSATDEIDMGKIIARTWPTEAVQTIRKGTKAYIYQGPKTITRTISETKTYIGMPSMRAATASQGVPGDGLPTATGEAAEQIATLINSSGGVLIKYSESQTPKSLGYGAQQLGLVDVSKTWVYEYFEEDTELGTAGSSVPRSAPGPRGSDAPSYGRP